MDKRKIVNAAREKAREKISAESAEDNDKSFIGGIIDTFKDIVGSDDEGERNGKVSGRKPQTKPAGRVASVGRNVADQLHNKK